MTDRSIKYAILLLLVTFALIWLIEIIAKVRVHMIQYLFISLGMCLFYLLLLALSEHISFGSAYFIASTAIIGMTIAYSKAVLRSGKRALLIGTAVTTLYVYLFILLQEKSYSLLLCSIGVFLILSSVMYITRDIEWNKVGTNTK